VWVTLAVFALRVVSWLWSLQSLCRMGVAVMVVTLCGVAVVVAIIMPCGATAAVIVVTLSLDHKRS